MSSKAEAGHYSPSIGVSAENWFSITHLLPAILAIVGATIMVLIRFQGSNLDILKETSQTNLALICYLASSLLFGMYLMGREQLMKKMATWSMIIGFMLNLSAWGMRWIEYTQFTQSQGDMVTIWPTLSLAEKINHTFPLSNLYDITLGLTTFLGITAVLVGVRNRYDFLGAITMPVGALFLILAVFLGNDINQPIQPILRSYWRPIHVGVAALSYGVCSVTFAVGILYLLKDKMRPERIALSIALFGVGIYLLVAALFGNFSLTDGTFGMNIVMLTPKMGEQPIRFSGARGDFLTVEFPFVGRFLQIVVVLFLASSAMYLKDMFLGEDAKLRKVATALFSIAIVFQALAIGTLYYQMKTTKDLGTHIPATGISKLNTLLNDDGHGHAEGDTSHQREQISTNAWLNQMGPNLRVNFSSNPVVSAGFFVILIGGLFFALFKLRGEQILKNLPSLEVLDDLNYKLVSVCFPGFTLMLILGAVWANESWGTYWSWDPKETWGLITWLAYASFLHTRFSHGWKGRRSAYFAILGFIFMLFTYLGVSYLLPGLHSYA
ncbi:MAG: cytochrome c biogenesis protein CcsA [Acidobacteria bacterium]|nr:cytochrome c biogenesis protein CcsA [Acidobacteriota bacterium]